MWQDLPEAQRQEYKKMILAFASLSKMFTQKEGSKNDEIAGTENVKKIDIPVPVVNSKYQETVFQRVFGATAEDINNTSFDAAIKLPLKNGKVKKYLIGLKVFRESSASGQKVAQFKANRGEWSGMLRQMEAAKGKEAAEINQLNHDLYMKMARTIADVRNARIESSEANLKGFQVDEQKDDVEAVYHFIMPMLNNSSVPCLRVGETCYSKIDIDNLTVKGCANKNTPANFKFSDGQHEYRFSASDHQLSMNFKGYELEDEWEVIYAEDAYAIFAGIAKQIYGDNGTEKRAEIAADNITESYSWKIKVEKCSGFNGFNGAPKMAKNQRVKNIELIRQQYQGTIQQAEANKICQLVENVFTVRDADERNAVRQDILKRLDELGDSALKAKVKSMILRPQNEMYIPLPDAKKFHEAHPDFFAPGAGTFLSEPGKKNKLAKPKEQRMFDLVFEPSGKVIRSFITQDNGKAIESEQHQDILGEWILQGVFQLKPYEPLTEERLERVGINGMRLYKKAGSEAVHLEFIQIDEDELPKDILA